MSFPRQLIFCCILLLIILGMFEWTSLDLWVQNHFYDATLLGRPPLQRWMIPKDDPIFEFWFHDIPRYFTTMIGVGAALLFAASYGVKRLSFLRYPCLFLALCLGLVAGMISAAKFLTHTYCPNQLKMYGGAMPYVKVLESYPADFKPTQKGKCFPAGHATTGFGFMALYFIFHTHLTRLFGLGFGLIFGWVLGIFQMLRGEHFLSHTLVSMVIAWMIILGIYSILKRPLCIDRSKSALDFSAIPRRF